jgi:multidrug efflux pump subunit AcrA (membrane-fusion protein)
MRRLNFLLTGLLAVLLASCNQRVQNIENKPAVKIDTVLSADKQTALQFPGRVKAAQDISLAFRVSGTIQRMYVNDGMCAKDNCLPNLILQIIRFNWMRRKPNTSVSRRKRSA